jgi:hypothetical protein
LIVEQTIVTKKSKSEWLDELKLTNPTEVEFDSKISMSKQLNARLFVELAEELDYKEANKEEEIIE